MLAMTLVFQDIYNYYIVLTHVADITASAPLLQHKWITIDERNNRLYYSILQYADGGWDKSYWILPTDFKQ